MTESLEQTENQSLNNSNEPQTKPLWKKDAPSLRKYQQQIYERATKEDLLVVIPTGLGKTYIAARLAAHVLAQNPNSFAFILAPTRPLISQHLKSLKEVIDLPEEKFKLLTGKVSPGKRAKFYFEDGQIGRASCRERVYTKV